MLYNLFASYGDDLQLFNLFRYLSFRSAGALFTSLVIAFLIAPRIIAWLKLKQAEGQPIRSDGPESHIITKKGTPTMGGIIILASVMAGNFLWADLTNPYVWIIALVTTGFGLIGFVDDYLKLTKRNTKGLSGKKKLAAQFMIAIFAALLIVRYGQPGQSTHLALPFIKNFLLDLGYLYIPFAMVVMVGSSNAVNLTDGLDGLAIVPVMIAAGCFGLIGYIVGNYKFAEYLQLHHVKGAGEIAVFCSALIGAGLGFLWYNAPPAKVFMGDTGSLALGGALGVISVIAKHELVLVIVGGIFVMEAVSVIIQVISYKTTGKRVFRMAPIHHHFEKLGWQEPTIVIRFWIIAIILALAGLTTLKIR